MLLAIDAGNTNTVFALHDGARFCTEWRCETVANRTADELFVWLLNLMHNAGIDPASIESTVIASVVPAATENLRTLSQRYFGAGPLVVGDADCQPGVDLKVDRPAVVGADRIANAVGAGMTYGADLIVVDFGTATTFDVIDEDRAYAGGVIAPGIGLSLDALHRAAANLPKIGVTRPDYVVGRDTVPAMQSGVYWGYISLIDGICERIKREMNAEMTVIATGGLAGLFEAECGSIQHVDPQLTMRGLVEIYRRNHQEMG